jgi:glycosyltransferase involved in cell wall biosynthesis
MSGLKSALNRLEPRISEPAPEARLREVSRESLVHRPHVCFVAPHAWPVLAGAADIKVVGGAEVQQSLIARALARSGFRVSMICLDFGQPDGVCVDGVTVYKTHEPDSGVPVLRFLHPRLTSVWSALRRADADIYYQRCGSMLTGVIAAFCRRYGRKSVYAGAFDTDFLPGKQQIQFARDRWLFEYGLRNVDTIVVQNPYQQETCLANYGRKSVLIPSGYAPPIEAAADEGGAVLWVATIRDYKQPELLLEIARRLPQLRFVMVGGPASSGASMMRYYEAIEREARSLPNVEFAGFVPFAGVEAYFNRARVFVNTSRHEGFPNTFLQAWARGIPTVAFFDTGSRRANEPVYPVVGDVCEATRAVQRLMLDDDHWRSASERCRGHYAAYHSIGSVTSRYSQVLLALGARP